MGREFGDRPGDEVVAELWGELSRELGTDGPEYTDTRNGQNLIGHLVTEDEDGQDTTSEEIAWNSHDTTDMSAEESAMHYDDDGGEEETLSEDVLHDLEGFED